MPATYSLATILSIAIPLGVVCLASILVLGIVFFRYITVSTREKRAYELARKGDYRRGSLHSTGSKRQEQEYKHNRSCMDVICCIPPSIYYTQSCSQQHSENYNPKLNDNTEGRVIPENQRRHSHISKTQNSVAKGHINKTLNVTNEKQSELAHKYSKNMISMIDNSNTKKTGSGRRSSLVHNVDKTREQQPINETKEQTRPSDVIQTYGNDIQTPESLSTPKTLSVQDSVYTPIHQPEGRFPHPYAQGARQPPVDSSPSSMIYSTKPLEGLPGSYSPLPTPPNIKAPSPHTPSPYRNNIRSENNTGSNTSPSFASKLRSLTPNQNEPYFPAKSELRNKHSWKKSTIPGDDTMSMREYYSANTSLRSNNLEMDSSYNSKIINAKFDQQKYSPHALLSQNGSRRPSLNAQQSEKQYEATSTKVNHTSTFPKIEETPLQLSSINPDDGFAEFFKTPDNNLMMTPPPPPESRQSQRAQKSKQANSPNDGSPVKKSHIITPHDKKRTNSNIPNSLSSSSVVDPDKIMKVLQKDEQIVTGNEHFGVTQVTKGHNVVPSYSGSFIQPLTENRFSKQPNDFIKNFQQQDEENSHSNGSSSKQTTPLNKMANFNTSSTTRMAKNMQEDLNPVSISKKANQPDISENDVSNEPLSSKSAKSPSTPEIEEVKYFSKSSVQLNSPLGSPNSSFVPSRHSSLSNKSFRRSRSFSTEHSFSYLKSQLSGNASFETIEERHHHTIRNNREDTSAATKKTSEQLKSEHVKGLSIIPVSNHTDHTFGTISTIAALNPPASPRSPGYEPSKGALITSSMKDAVHYKNIPAVKKDNQRTKRSQSDSKKKTIKTSRINKPLPSTPVILEDGVVTHLHGAKFLVVAAYKARLSDEIDLEVGDIVKVNEVFDDNWCRARIVQSSMPTINRNLRGVCPKVCLAENPQIN